MIKVLKTYEIDDSLWKKIVQGFNESFDRNATVKSFKSGFCTANQWGYAYHALAFDDESGDLMAFNSYTPTFYKNGVNALVSGSTFIKPNYRKDFFLFYKLITALRNQGIEDGFHIEIGVPNPNSREYARRLLKNEYVADLDYYILPRNVSVAIGKPSLKFFDGVFRFIFCTHLLAQNALSLVFNYKEKETKYSLITDSDFYKARFKSPAYSKYESGNYLGYYRIVDEEGKRVAYVFDFRCAGVRTRKALTKVVRYIFLHEKSDAILFVGFLRLRQFTLFKVPQKLIPKPLPLTYYVLDKSRKDEFKDLADKSSWDFSLMNFDVR